MSERWKYQIKTGGFWAVFMIVFMTLFDWKEKPILNELTTPYFYIKVVVYLATGIFFVGYFSWKAKNGKEYTWSDLFGKKKK
jgi:hypothetical protein